MSFNLSKISQFFKPETLNSVQDSIIGVDIGSSSIKIVQIHKKKDFPVLDTYGELQLGPYADMEIGQTTQLGQTDMVKVLVDLVRESSITGNTVALAVSHKSSFVTILTLPAVDQTKLASLVPIEARKYLPLKLDEVTLDWHQTAVDRKNNKSQVLLGAVDNESLQRYRSMIIGADLDLKLTELEVFSIVRAALKKESKATAVIDFGASGARAYLTRAGNLTKTHSTLVGGQQLTESIMREMNIDFAQAEQIKRDRGLSASQDAPIKKVLEKELERSFSEIHQVIEKQQQIDGGDVMGVVLTGGSALLPELVPYLSERFQKKVELANSFTKIGYPAFLEDTLKEIGPQFTVAIGVALRGLSIE